jgi:hypothetical protein
MKHPAAELRGIKKEQGSFTRCRASRNSLIKRQEIQMKYKQLLFSLITMLILTCNAEAANNQFKVQFVVAVGNELTDQVKSYVTRELRGLPDVKIIHKDPDLTAYHISIFPISVKLSNGITTVVAISYVFEKDGLIEHVVLSGPPEQLKTLCEEIIARFDKNWLEPKRHK